MTGAWAATTGVAAVAFARWPGLGLDPVPEPSDVTPGWLGFGFLMALVAATILLWFSMRKQLRKIRFDEDPDASEAGKAPAAEPGTEPAAPPAPVADRDVEPPASERP